MNPSHTEPFISIELVQMSVMPGKLEQNAQSILKAIESAKKSQKDWMVFPELCLSGYLLGDMWERPAFLRECNIWQKRIVEATEGITLFMGNVQVDWESQGEDGRPLKYNAAVVAHNGKVLHHPTTGHSFVSKTLLPNYREFDDSRHFSDLRKWSLEQGKPLEDVLQPITIPLPHRLQQEPGSAKTVSVGVTLCEDGWSQNYSKAPFEILTQNGADVLLNLSCSPYTLGKESARHRTFQQHATTLQKPILYVNSVGLQNNGKNLYTFDGSSTVYNQKGNVLYKAPAWEEATESVTYSPDFQTIHSKESSPLTSSPAKTNTIAEVYKALRYGAQAFMKQHGIQNVVIGVSGGIDSAVAAAMYRSFLPEKQILLVSMPGPYTSNATRSLAQQLGKNTGCYFLEVPIAESVEWSRKQLGTLSLESVDGQRKREIALTDFHLENVQARDRSSRILSALSCSFGGVFTCNANKTEMTIGYSTLYGDLGGYMALLGDLWKDQVYDLARYLNQEVYKREVVPQGTIDIVPSAELSASQDVTKGQGDPLHYPYHDKLFYSWVQRWERATPEDNLRWYLEGTLAQELGCPEECISELFPTAKDFVSDLERWWNLYQGMAVAKRVQAPPILSLSSRAFGYDHREFLGTPYYSEEYMRLKAGV